MTNKMKWDLPKINNDLALQHSIQLAEIENKIKNMQRTLDALERAILRLQQKEVAEK